MSPPSKYSSLYHADGTSRLLLASLGMFVFFFEAYLALQLSSLSVFDQYNVIFDTDPKIMRSSFANGFSAGGLTHPLLAYYFSVPIRSFSYLLSTLGLAESTPESWEYAALFVAPFCSSVKTIAIFMTFRFLKFDNLTAFFLALIGALSFSSVIFGSTPNSYAITGMWLAIMSGLAILTVEDRPNAKVGPLLLAGAGAIGTTISNVIYLGWLLLYQEYQRTKKFHTSLVRAVLLSGGILVSVVLASLLMEKMRVTESESFSINKFVEFVSEYLPDSSQAAVNVLRFPEMIARTIVPTKPTTIPNSLSMGAGSKIPYEFTYKTVPFGWGALTLTAGALGVLVGGAIIAWQLGGTWRYLGLASSSSIVTFGILYSWFGLNTFLYSQTWLIPSLLISSAWLKIDYFQHGIRQYVALALIALLLMAGNIYVVDHMLDLIKQSVFARAIFG